jgi:hypothetical protein
MQQEEQKKKWMELCEQAADEQDPKKLTALLTHAHEKRQPFLLRLVQAVKDYVSRRTPRKPIIESLNIIEKNRGKFLRMPIFRHNVQLLCGLNRYESPVIGVGKRQEYFLAGSSVIQLRGIFKPCRWLILRFG